MFKVRKFFLANVTQVAHEKYVNETYIVPKCSSNTIEKPCKWIPSLNWFVTTELARPYFHFTGTDVADNKLFMEQVANFCTIDKVGGLNIFVKLIVEQLKKNVNFKFACPMQKV